MLKLSVTSLVRYLKNKLDIDNNLQKINVSGEISNFHRHFSGHLYFTLKDDNASINCVMFKSYASELKFEPKNGDKVLVLANTSIFESTGQLQLYVLRIEYDGLGQLYQQYEQLKNKLIENGYFDDNHKIQLEKTYIDKVAVLVGEKSAAMSDIKTMFKRRWPLAKVDYYPCLVQGSDAANDIISKLKQVDDKGYDAIILARGGGSFEDLFCFNDENLVLTIYSLKTFIITGVGHEQDYTLVDFVADLRAPTPTATVELITPNINDEIDRIDEFIVSLKNSLNAKLNSSEMNFDYLVDRLLSYQKHLESINEKIDLRINNLKIVLDNKIDNYNLKIINNIKNVRNLINMRLNDNKMHFKRLNTLLEAYNNDNIINRGFTLIYQDNMLIKTSKELKNKVFDIKFKDKTIKAIKEPLCQKK